MAEYTFDLGSIIKKYIEAAINEHVYEGKSITEWTAIGMKAPRWISVKDRLPETDGEYIVYITSDDGEKCVTCDHWVKSSHERWFLFDDAGAVVTHWMPLPEPPKEENNG